MRRLTVLLLHCLKWRFQPNLRGRSSSLTIKEQRKEVLDHLADNPSLQSKADGDHGRHSRPRQSSRPPGRLRWTKGFPAAACPWTFDEATADVWPE